MRPRGPDGRGRGGGGVKRSAGILLYKHAADGPLVLLVHPGGPFWRRKDEGAWSIPKGEIGPREEPLAAALREFAEETGVRLAAGNFAPLGEVTQSGGKRVVAWALKGEFDPAAFASISFEMEWPPRSGRRQSFPEIDRAAWFDLPAARSKMLPSQLPFLERLEGVLAGQPAPPGEAER